METATAINYDHPSLEKLKMEDVAFSNLLAYCRFQYPQYEIARHHRLLSGHLESVEQGKMDRLIICLPPRSGKTMLMQYFLAWFLGRNPSKQVIYSTYSFDRSSDSGREIRNQMVDPLFQTIFPACTVSLDSKGANKVSTSQGGVFYAVGIGGAITGRGADVLVCDDVTKSHEQLETSHSREKLYQWYNLVARTRLQPNGRIIIVQTRWHHADLVGYLLDDHIHEGWRVLNIPAIAEDDDLIGREPGEPLWPDRYPLEVLEDIKQAIGSRDWSALYQGKPLPTEGNLVELDWFSRYSGRELRKSLNQNQLKITYDGEPVNFTQIVCSWDTAFSEKAINDPSACTVWARTKHGFYLIDVFNKQVAFPDLYKSVMQLSEKYTGFGLGAVRVLIENRASGQSLIQELRRFTRIPVIKIEACANKQTRLSEVTALIEAGKVFLPEKAPWLVNYETQMVRFPLDKHDDMVDSTSQFLRWGGRRRYVRSKKALYWK